MLSLSNVKTGKAAASYYEMADDYYSDGVSPSRWYGQGATDLGLHGAVDATVFAALLEGQLPNGQILHRGAAGRRGGTDGTFSAPKSVSLQALIDGDTRILKAHRSAVNRTLKYAQTLATCRVTELGVTRTEITSKLVIACFDHDLSRATDPQIHTHCVMLNATQRENGQWRALDNQSIYRNKMLLGALYRVELAQELQILGYDIRLTHGDGRFELAHISDKQVKAFSQRSAAIEGYLKEHKGLERNEASAWDKNLVAVLTRDKKTAVDRASLCDEWQRLSRVHGIDYTVPVQVPTGPTQNDLSPIVAEAVAHLSERQSVFHHQALLQATLERAVGEANLEEVEVAIRDAIQRGELVRDGERFTTPTAQQMERDILTIESRGRGCLRAIYPGERAALHAHLSAGLNDGQKEAVLGMLLSTHRVTGIQGRAGAGKTTLLKEAARQARACGYTVAGLAPSASAARELAGAGIDAITITSFMHRSNKGLGSHVVLIVDEAGMASTRQMHVIVSEAEKASSRVVLVGDTSQLQAVEAGKPFAQLQANGMRTCVVSEIQRQKNPVLKQAVGLTVDGQVAMAVELLDKHIQEIPDAAERFERIASNYVTLPEAERATTRVISGTRYARNEINRAIRDKLGLVEQGHEFTLLERKDLTVTQARSILNYDIGDVLLAEANYPSLGIKRGEMVKVVERTDRFILVERQDGGQATWQPALATKLTAYVQATRQLAIGDKVRITGNDRARGLINGDLARVASVEAESKALTLCFEEGRKITLDGRSPLLLDHGYCSTVYSAQGQTCDRVLIEADAHSLTANENSFYVAISRARHHAQIYTDDREMLPIAMGRELQRAAALEITTKPVDLSNLSL